MEQIREVGSQLTIDDFFTGFSSLSYLRRFTVDILKIDQSFIQRVPSDESDRNLIRGIINMATELGIVVIAEGVEKKYSMIFWSKTAVISRRDITSVNRSGQSRCMAS